MAESQFDVENALPRLADAILPMLPHDIPLLENEADEQEDLVADPAPAPGPTVLQTGAGERLEEVPGPPQPPPLNNVADLALELDNFREAERRRILGDSTQETVHNRRQAEGYMNSESDEEYLQDDEDDEDQLNDEDSSMELDPDLPPPANDASRGSSSNLQMQEAEHGVHSEHRSERSCFTTLGFIIINDLEVVAEVQYFDSGLPDQGAEPVNTEELVPPELNLTFSDGALSTQLQGPSSDPIFPVIEEGHDVHEIRKHVNPSSWGIFTLAASMTPKTLLPGTSDTSVLCESALEPATSSAAKGRISEGVPVQKPAANASVSEGESLLKPAV